MYFTDEEIRTMAWAVVTSIGTYEDEEDDYCSSLSHDVARVYAGFGLAIGFPMITGSQRLTIRYESRIVFNTVVDGDTIKHAWYNSRSVFRPDLSQNLSYVFEHGVWEDILYELCQKSSKVRADGVRRETEARAQAAWIRQLNEDCCNYLPLTFNYHVAPARSYEDGFYEDSVVRVTNSGDRSHPSISIYRKKGLFGKSVELVFKYDGTFVDGDWLGHVQRLIEQGKARRQREIATELAARPTAQDYLNQIRNL